MMPSREQIERLREEKNGLPPVRDLAARVRDGESVRSLALEYGVDRQGLSNRLRHAGYRFDTGEPERVALKREMRERLAASMRTYSLPWMERAACSRVDAELWFPEKGQSTKDAKAICRTCPVQRECAEMALANRERFGIFGGLSERERRKLIKKEAA